MTQNTNTKIRPSHPAWHLLPYAAMVVGVGELQKVTN